MGKTRSALLASLFGAFACVIILVLLFFALDQTLENVTAEQNKQYQEQLEAVSEEIGVDPKNILPLETKHDDTKRFKTDAAEYLIKFDENNQIRAIVKDSE